MTTKQITYDIIVEKADNQVELRYLVTNEGLPIADVCLWLDWESIRSPLTGRTYAYSLLPFLRFLKRNKLTHRTDDTRQVIEEFLKGIVFADCHVLPLHSPVTYQDLKKYLVAIKSFYKWLESEQKISENPAVNTHSSSKYAQNYTRTKLLYGQIFDFDIETTLLAKLLYKSPKEYFKWYSDQDIERLSRNFNRLRDKAIFFISIETGMRIGEICGLKLADFSVTHQSLSIRRQYNTQNKAFAKTAERTNYISKGLISLIQLYLSTERNSCHSAGDTPFLFINLKGSYKGNPLSPTSYLAILKRCASKAGLDPRLIRTHNGRSTRAQKLIELMRDHPESGVTTTFILEELGWRSERSMVPYIKHYSLGQKQKILESIQTTFPLVNETWYNSHD